jgi:hypothetical protein
VTYLKGLPLAERLAIQATTGPADTCWPWAAARDRDGYGVLSGPNRKQLRAHRVAWMLAVGPIPDGLHVLHRCDNPPCVNPAHLWLGTNADNSADMARKGRAATGLANGAYTQADRRPRGEAHGRAKLTDADVAAIRAAYGSGEAQADIARRYNVGRAHVWRIVHELGRVA